MTRRMKSEQALLWVFVLLSAIVVGAGFYEMRVTVPTWTHSPPESVWFWEQQRAVDPRYVPDSGIRFWIYLTPLHLLLSLVMLGVGWTSRSAHRTWIIVSAAFFAVLHLSAFVWFVPVLRQLATSQADGLSGAVVASKARLWLALSWIRAPLGVFGFIAALKAFRQGSSG